MIDPKLIIVDRIIQLAIKDDDTDANDILNMLLHHTAIVVAANFVGHLKHHDCANKELPQKVITHLHDEIWKVIKEICDEHDITIPESHNEKVAREILEEIKANEV